ncbi:glycosyl hydrolase family 18 protein [Fluviispira vulneris]|uniref:glycosyl hydrolase family 18 protein n=1 Tax=Fluviispira vulneris TaxID=2763012 RepID=UPI0016459384|nr:glycosyl hydrolase family 18 protein [Fluviispira vulneris]
MKKILISSFVSLSLITHANAHLIMSYVEVNSNQLSNVGCFVRSDNAQPFIHMTSIFAANINGDNPNNPVIYFNPQVKNLLTNEYKQVENLQKMGIKVLITLLGNHQNAGWACMTNMQSKIKFAKDIVQMVNKYKLDGVDIDDEYSNCSPNENSLADLAQLIKADPAFKNKILSKALFSDSFEFSNHKLAKYLDYGWEMTYSSNNFAGRLNPYLSYGMKKEKLLLGSWTQISNFPPSEITQYVVKNNFAGIMIYDITANSQNFLNSLVQTNANNSLAINVLPNCLK